MKLYSIDDFRIDKFSIDRYRLDNYRIDGAKSKPSKRALSELDVGDKIKFGKYQVESEAAEVIIWKIAAKNHTGYPINSVTLIPEKIIDLRCFDAIEPTRSDGNNRYSLSNIDQWLNKDSAAGAWYVAAHADDAPPETGKVTNGAPYNNKTGFLNLFSLTEKAKLLATTIRVVKSSFDGGGYEDISRKIFLPSTTEVGLANEGGTAEGAKFALFSDNASRISYLTQQAFNNTTAASKPTTIGNAWYWYLRTPNASETGKTRAVYSDGTLYSIGARYGNYGLRPVCNLAGTTGISETPDGDGCYTVI